MRYVTKTGCAVRTGRVTRRSKSVRKPTGVKPLPLHLQCHPQHAHPLPVHPDCKTTAPVTGGVLACTFFAPLSFMYGRHLNQEPGPIEIEVVGHGTWYANDSKFAFMWAKAARLTGLTVNVYVNTGSK